MDDNNQRNNNDPTLIQQDKAYCVNLVRERDGEGYCECRVSTVYIISLCCLL